MAVISQSPSATIEMFWLTVKAQPRVELKAVVVLLPPVKVSPMVLAQAATVVPTSSGVCDIEVENRPSRRSS